MLSYLQNSDEIHAVDEITKLLHSCVAQVKESPDSQEAVMTLGEYWDSIAEDAREEGLKEGLKEGREEGREETREEDIVIWISTLQELHVSKDNARNMLIEKYSDFSEKADKLIEKYWK